MKKFPKNKKALIRLDQRELDLVIGALEIMGVNGTFFEFTDRELKAMLIYLKNKRTVVFS